MMKPGLSFLPDPNQPMAPKKRDLGEAYKILSLQLPRMMGAQSMSQPAAPQMGPSDEHHKAVFEALLRGMSGGGGMGGY